MASDPETLPDDPVEVPPPFDGEQVLTLDDYEVRAKENGFWVRLSFTGANGEWAAWSGNFFKAPDTDGRKMAHRIAWGGIRDFFRATGMGDGDLPAASPKQIAAALQKLSKFGSAARVRAFVSLDKEGRFMEASRFKAA